MVKMNTSSFDVAHIHSLDPEAIKLYEKYKALKMNSESTKGTPNDACANIQKTDSTKLDSMIICSNCKGMGICQEIYNHQSRDVNCPQCDSEGILWKQSINGELKKSLSSTDE